MSILEAIHARPSVRASLSGRGKLIFTRGTKNQVCRRQRDDCADASDKMYVADLLETEIFLGCLESISGCAGNFDNCNSFSPSISIPALPGIYLFDRKKIRISLAKICLSHYLVSKSLVWSCVILCWIFFDGDGGHQSECKTEAKQQFLFLPATTTPTKLETENRKPTTVNELNYKYEITIVTHASPGATEQHNNRANSLATEQQNNRANSLE